MNIQRITQNTPVTIPLASAATVLITVMGAVWWFSSLQAVEAERNASQDADIRVIRNDVSHVEDRLKEIQESLLRMEQKLDKRAP